MTISIPSWSVIPSTCGVSAVFEAKWYENGIYKSLPSYITYSTSGHSFNVELDDYSYAGTYVISLIGQTPDGYQDPPLGQEVFFEIEIIDPCGADALTNPSTIDSFEYIVDYSGLVTVPIQTYDQSLVDCPTEWSLVLMSGTTELALTSTQASYIVLQSDGSIDIDCGDDTSIAGESWTLRLKATSTRSSSSVNNEVLYDFTMTLAQSCENDQLTSTSSIDDKDYFIGQTGLYQIEAPTYEQVVTGCPLTWSIVNADNGSLNSI